MRQEPLRRLSSLVACLSTLAWAEHANATVLWTATFEKGDLSEWMPGVNPTKGTRKNVEVLGEQVYGGKWAGKITCHPDDTFNSQNRVDIQHQSTLTAQNEQTWISGHYMMPEDAKVRNEFAFFESNSTFQNAMDFYVEPKMGGGGTNIVFGVGDLGRTVLWTGDFKAGAWHQVAIHVLWSTDAAVGTVDVWFDGVQVVTNRKAQTSRDTNTLFFQTGLHRRSVGQVTDIIYLDDFVEADNFEDARIAPPIGGDGGVAPDASGTGTGGSRPDGGSDASGAGGSGGALDAGIAAGGSTGAGGAIGAGGSTGAGGSAGAGTSTGTTSTGSGVGGLSGVTSGTTGTTGTGTTGATVGAGGSTSSTGGPNATPDSTAGCACTVLSANRSEPRWVAAGLAIGAAIVARRRRRRS